MASNVPPALIFIAGAAILLLIPRRFRSLAYLLFPIAAFIHLVNMDVGTSLVVPIHSYDLILLQVDRLSLAFGYIFVIISFLGGIYSLHVKDTGQLISSLLYAGSSLGVIFAGDLITLFAFWEIMMVGSSWLILSSRTTKSGRAGVRYFLVHSAGGLLLLAGIWLHVSSTGSLSVGLFEAGTASYLILIGFALNAAVPPLNAWLPDAYPEATPTGSVFLSAFTTKVAVYALIRCFAGFEALVWVGTAMAIYGVVFAILQNDIRRLLSYHIISQVGYMVTAVGIGTEMALNGATAHAFTHILYKALLFMGAGSVIYATGHGKLTRLGGLSRAMPITLVLYMIGAFSISGFPLFSGFVSKSMVVYAAGVNNLEVVVLLLYLVSIATFLSVGLKLPFFTWFGPSRSLKPTATPSGMYIGMGLTAGLSIAIGVYPSILYDILPFTVEYKPYTVAKVVETMQLLALTGFGFWLLVPRLAGKDTITLDTDWFYRRLPRLAYNLAVDLQIVAGFQRAHESVINLPRTLCDHFAYRWRQSRAIYHRVLGAAFRQAESRWRNEYQGMLPYLKEYSGDIALGSLLIAISLALFLILAII